MTQTWIYLSLIILIFSFTEKIYKSSQPPMEICDNAIDDDNDGLIDINDPDCICQTVSLASLIPNPSFEDYNCCPETDSELNCAAGWDQASGGTTDYVHTCDYLAAASSLVPFPDGEGAVQFLTGSVDNGNGLEIYKEYAGACLNRTMKKDSIYRIKFHLGFLDAENSPEIRFSFFGSPSCEHLPFSIFADCPTTNPDWYFLRAEIVSSDSPGWVEVSTVIQPFMDIEALVIGDDCSGDPEGMLRVYFIDNLRLNDESNFDFELLDQRSPCDLTFRFEVTDRPNFSYQWYKEGVALIGETSAKISRMYEAGTYQLRIINNATQDCRIADDFEFIIPSFEQEVFESICEGQSLLFAGDIIEAAGIYEYTLTSVEGCDSIVTLNVETPPNRTEDIFIQKLPGTTYRLGEAQFIEEGEHLINLVTAEGCDSTVVLHLENINVYIPNAFSPNGDNLNDYFEVFTSNGILIKEISIFDRWGSLIYEGNKWDGRYNNQPVDQGVFVYLIRLTDITGEELIFSNSLTLLK